MPTVAAEPIELILMLPEDDADPIHCLYPVIPSVGDILVLHTNSVVRELVVARVMHQVTVTGAQRAERSSPIVFLEILPRGMH